MAELTERTSKSRRGCLRFTLRTLLILFTVVGALLGWIGWELEQVRSEKNAVAWINSVQGTSIDTPTYRDNSGIVERLAVYWKYRLLGGRVHYVNLKSSGARDLLPLADLKKVELLRLGYTEVSDISPLAELEDLKSLHLDGSKVIDLAPLANLKNLSELDLRRTSVSDLSPLTNIKSLKEMRLNETLVDDLSPLAGLENLEYLILVDTRVTDGQVQDLRNALPNCTVIGPLGRGS